MSAAAADPCALAYRPDVQAALHGPGPAATRGRAVGGVFARAVQTSQHRFSAAILRATALGVAEEHAEAVRLQRGVLNVETRALGPEHRETLICATHLAASLVQLGECAETAVLLRTTLAAKTSTVGADNEGTLATEGFLVGKLLYLGEYT